MPQENTTGEETAKGRMSRQEKAGLGTVLTLIGGAGLYLVLGWVGSIINNDYVRLNPRLVIEEKVVRYEESPVVKGFWRYFPFVDKDGIGITTIWKQDGSLEARLTDNNNDGIVGNGDVVEQVEEVDGIRGTVTYHDDKVVDSDGKTEFTEPSTVLQARLIEHGRQERAKWNSWLQNHYPTIKAILQEQQQQYQQQRK